MEDLLSGVARTCIIPLVARAVETESGSPRLRDPDAVRIVNELGVTRKAFRVHPGTIEGSVRRTLWFDGQVSNFMASHRGASVVNLGAGLDARFDRLDDGRVQWFDVDLPDCVNLRRRFFQDGPRRQMIGMDMFSPELFDRLGLSRPSLFIMEGLVMYLPVEKLRAFFQRAAEVSGGEALFDVVSPFFAARSSRLVREVGRSKAAMEWGVRSASELPELFPSIQVLKTQEYGKLTVAQSGLLPALVFSIPFFQKLFFSFMVHARLVQQA